MIGLIQLVTHAEVNVENKTIGAIQTGILALVGIEKTDTQTDIEKLITRILNYRIFADAEGKMNLSLLDIQGGLLLVPQFTLVAETKKGTRPGFSKGMPPIEGERLFNDLINYARTQYSLIETGKFGADMQVTLCNSGPVTFILTTN